MRGEMMTSGDGQNTHTRINTPFSFVQCAGGGRVLEGARMHACTHAPTHAYTLTHGVLRRPVGMTNGRIGT